VTTRARWLGIVALAFSAVVATFVLAAVRQHREATRRLDAANTAFVQQKWRDAAQNARAAALRALPHSDVQRSAFAVLERTARSASSAGDASAALVAWTDMHEAAVATRSIASDTSAWEQKAEAGVREASGAAGVDVPSATSGGPPSNALRLSTGALVLTVALVLVVLTRAKMPSR